MFSPAPPPAGVPHSRGYMTFGATVGTAPGSAESWQVRGGLCKPVMAHESAALRALCEIGCLASGVSELVRTGADGTAPGSVDSGR